MDNIKFVSNSNEMEKLVFFSNISPVLLSGPTGSGKTTMVHTYARDKNYDIVTVTGDPNMTLSYLVGNFLPGVEKATWIDGPLTNACRRSINGEKILFYFDEISTCPSDVLTGLHSLLDHRRTLFLPKLNERITVSNDFRFIGSFNPEYGNLVNTISPAFWQRCIRLHVPYLSEQLEIELITKYTHISTETAKHLVRVGTLTRTKLRNIIVEGAGTRLLLKAAQSFKVGYFNLDNIIFEIILQSLTTQEEYLKMIVNQLVLEGLMDPNSYPDIIDVPDQPSAEAFLREYAED
ncbi:AAA family ATPase [Myxococcota bacterium]|nr:AAA family ATPase [Myxococcota bacterium]MBU1381841.1 AAA family ATPase [Myxococcota bacterium]MBU1499038.1 AAA family ATPase [Myxococcota bacterium]